MVKSITGLLVGLAIADGAIQSVDDLPEKYVPALKGSEYGRTPIRALLHMSSGVEFGEDRDNGRDLNRLWRGVVAGHGPGHGTIDAIRQFNHRIAPPGTRYAYASIEPDVLGMVLKHTIGKTASAYLQERIWQPIGTESDATWMVDAEGYELGHFGFSAVLRDYARLGRLLAHDGAWNGHQVIPARWMIEATTVRPRTAICSRARRCATSATAICCGCCPAIGASSPWSAISASASSSIRRPSSSWCRPRWTKPTAVRGNSGGRWSTPWLNKRPHL